MAKRKTKTARQKSGRPRPKRQQEHSKAEDIRRVRVRVVGVGGGGSSIAGEVASRVSRADFAACNTDAQALKGAPSRAKRFLFGQSLTQGLGCGMDAELGAQAAKAEKERIKKLFEGQDLCVILASLGGGTGSGAAPVFCQAAREAGCLTLGVFTLPFQFEGEKRQQVASAALERAQPFLNAYIVLPNERIFGLIDRNTSLRDAFSAVNKRLADALEGLVETIFLPGVINTDFADLRSLLEGRGKLAYLNSARVGGPSKTQEAAKQIMANPLLGYGPAGAERILFTIASDRTMKMHEVAEISEVIAGVNQKAKIIFGLAQYPRLRGRLQVTFFAVGCKTEGAVPGKKGQKRRAASSPTTAAGPADAEQAKDQTGKRQSKKAGSPKAEAKKKVKLKTKPAARKPRQKTRRSALDVKRASERELQELEEQEKAWEVPAFLRKI